MADMIIRTKFMKKMVSKIIVKALKKYGFDSEIEIDELELKLGKKPRLSVNLKADILVEDLIEIIKNQEEE